MYADTTCWRIILYFRSNPVVARNSFIHLCSLAYQNWYVAFSFVAHLGHEDKLCIKYYHGDSSLAFIYPPVGFYAKFPYSQTISCCFFIEFASRGCKEWNHIRLVQSLRVYKLWELLTDVKTFQISSIADLNILQSCSALTTIALWLLGMT